MPSVGGFQTEDETLSHLFYDYIVLDDSEQGSAAVISLTECIIGRIRQDLPHVTHVFLLSDNASAYQSSLVP